MSWIFRRGESIRGVAVFTIFIFAFGTTLRLQAQAGPIGKESPETAAVSWLQAGFNAAHTGYNSKEKTLTASNVAGLTQTWLFQTNAEINVPSLTSKGTVYADSSDGNLYAIDASTGQELWKFSGTNTGDGLVGNEQGMAISGSTIYVNCQIDSGHGGVCALKASTGKLLWSWAIYNEGGPVNSAPYSAPVISNGVLVFGESDSAGERTGYIVGLNAKTGALLWEIGNCGGPNGANDCYQPSNYAATVSKGVVYYGTFVGNNSYTGVCAVQLSTGASLWCANTGDPGSPVTVSGNTVFVDTFNGTVFALNAKTGSQLWSVTGLDCGNNYNRPAVVKQTVYVGGTYYGQQYALAAKTGKVMWTTNGSGGPTYASAPSVANGVVYAECNGTCAIDASSGALVWDSQFGGGTTSQPAIVNGTLYAVCGSNNLCAYNLPK
jgi:outer membrane protein assembly factor BamB